MQKISLPARLENLGNMIQFVLAFAEEQGFDQKRIQEMEVALEEALVNIINYAYPDNDSGEVEVSCRMDDEIGLIITLSDSGISFDLYSASEPDLEATVSNRPIGGLGIYLIKQMVDELKYHRDGDKNIFTLIFFLNHEEKDGGM